MHVHARVCASAVPSLSLVNYASLSLHADELAASCLALHQRGKKKPAKAVCVASTRSLTRFPLTSVFSALHLCVVSLSRKSVGSITGGRLLNQLFLISSAD